MSAVLRYELFLLLSEVKDGSKYMDYITELEDEVKLLTEERDSLDDKVSGLEDDINSLEAERDDINDLLEEVEKTKFVVDDIIKDFYFYRGQKYKTKDDILFALEFGA